jgi:hypothetical protein
MNGTGVGKKTPPLLMKNHWLWQVSGVTNIF